MTQIHTPSLGLPYPDGSSPADVPTDISALANALDAQAAVWFPSPGDIKLSAASAAPSGWLFCDGSPVSRTTYPGLYDAIGTTYGTGDGTTTFNLPDLRTRVPLGAGTNHPRGQTGGEETHTLANGEMPVHGHGGLTGGGATGGMNANQTHAHGSMYSGGSLMQAFANPPGNVVPAYGSAANIGYPITSYADIGHGHSVPALGIANDGGGGSHNNMPPFVVITYLIKT